MATSKDVAQLAGVSHTTVSRAFRGDVNLRKETYDRVMKAAAELNYTPNFLASSLKRRRSGTIGLVISDGSNPFFTGVAQRLEEILDRQGYRLMIAFDGGNPDKQRRMVQAMAASQAEAIAFTPIPSAEPPDYIRNPELKLIQLFGRQYQHLSSLCFDDCTGARAGMAHLLEQGHRRILVLGGQDRRQGCLDACAGFPDAAPAFFSGMGTKEEIERALAEKIEQTAPTALFAVGNWHGRFAFGAMRQLGLRFPEDVSFVMFDDLQWTQMLDITVITHPLDELVDALSREIIALVEQKAGPSSRLFRPFLIERSSVRQLALQK